MQTFGLQVVLNSSNAVERVQQAAQQHGAVTAAQFKDVIDKENENKKSEVQGLEPAAVEVRIRDDLRHPRQQHEKKGEAGEKAGGTEEIMEETTTPVASAEKEGRRLDIKI
ncbi:MAG: hypothetical protein HY098_06465 [Nitrospinae bacterium]|nr:hypothetical protein [Nitrospinota bacterium]